jgi:hypothetical protein
MPRECTVCAHESRDAIEDAFIEGTPKRRIASHYGLTERAVRHHIREHLLPLLALARDAERAARADSLLDRIEALQSRTEAALARAEDTDNFSAIFSGIREMRSNLELVGEITKELNRAPTLNIHLSPEWLELRAVIVAALEPYSQARDAVLRALGSTDNGRA